MNYSEELQKLIQEYETNCMPSVAVDLVIFGFHQRQLKVLLLRFKGSQEWLLPSGRIRKQEDIDDAAYRSLQERTGLEELFLQQFHVFGKVNRLVSAQETLVRLGFSSLAGEGHRDISVGYYALVDYTQVNPTSDFVSDECRWWSIDQMPHLLFDHNAIIGMALKTLRLQLSYQPVGYNLLPETFTMNELRSLYETILGRSLDRGNFYKQMMSYGILEQLEKRPTIPSSKAPYLYRFHKEQYEQLLKNEDLSIGWPSKRPLRDSTTR